MLLETFRKTFVLFIIALFFTSFAAEADFEMLFSDPEGDVIDQGGNTVRRPDVDILEVETRIEDETLFFIVKVAGTIRQYDPDYSYTFYALEEKTTNMGDTQGVMVAFNSGEAYYTLSHDPSEVTDLQFSVMDEILTIEAPIDAFDFMDNFYLHVIAHYMDSFSDQRATDTASSWLEPPTNDAPPPENDAPENDDDDTPWIGVFAFFMALMFAAIWKKLNHS